LGWKITAFCVGFIALAIYVSPKLPEMTTAKVAPGKDTWRYDKSFSQDVVEAAVRPVLRDPQSAIFRDLSATNDRKIGKSPAGLVVCGYVNAKNGCCVVLSSAVILECLQTLTPDRHGTMIDASEKLVGGALGIIATRAALYLWHLKRFPQSQT
jgi:hypothetical protein